MLSRTITLSDGTEVTITYDSDGTVITLSSNAPAFYFLVGPVVSVNVKEFTKSVFVNIGAVVLLVYQLAGELGA